MQDWSRSDFSGCRSFQELIDLFVNGIYRFFLKLQFYYDNPFWQIWINIQYLYPIEIPLRGIARNCSRIAQHCAEMRGILRNFEELCELRGAIKIYLDWNPNQNTLIYSESIYNMQSYEKLAFCI